MLRNKEAKIINIGGGISQEGDRQVIITGDGRYEENGPRGKVIRYHDQLLSYGPDVAVQMMGTGSSVNAVDWDGDGDFDLLIGDVDGAVHLITNEGTADAWRFGIDEPVVSDGTSISVGTHASPCSADWDSDGDIDLLVGDGDGVVWYFENAGSRNSPQLAAAKVLVSAGDDHRGSDAPVDARRGAYAKVCATDWNGDGVLDLLVGDTAFQRVVLTPAQAIENEQLQSEIDVSMRGWRQTLSQLEAESSSNNVTSDAKKKLDEDLRNWTQRIHGLRRRMTPTEEVHGWIWYFAQRGGRPLKKS
jgi:hypothetical protein